MGHNYNNPDDTFAMVKVYVPRALVTAMKVKSEQTGLPVSRLFCIAVDNELDAPVPFNFPCILPSNTYIEMAYAEEAQLIAKYLVKFVNGCGRDQLMLCRRDIGILNKTTFMLAFRELLEVGVIEEVPVPRKVKFKYPAGYKYVRLKHIDKSALLKRKKRELARLAAEVSEAEEIFEGEKKAKLEKYGVKDEPTAT